MLYLYDKPTDDIDLQNFNKIITNLEEKKKCVDKAEQMKLSFVNTLITFKRMHTIFNFKIYPGLQLSEEMIEQLKKEF